MTAKTSNIATTATWSFTDNEETMAALESAARVVAGRRSGSSEDDLYQEAMLYLGTRPELAVAHPAKVYQHTIRYLEQEEVASRKVEYASSGGAPEEWEEDMGLYNNGMQDDPFSGLGYPERLVERLLEGMWNGWVVTDEFRPDSDMPKAKPNPSRLGTDVAHRIDIERAWERVPLTGQQHIALQLTLGQGLTHEAAGAGMGITQQSVSEHVEKGLRALCLYLNGVEEDR